MPKSIRGLIANEEALIALMFHVNPNEVEWEKEPKYESDAPAGFDGEIDTWVSGGPKMLKFRGLFDSTKAAVDNNFVKFNIPLIGVMGVEAVIESFLKPQKGPLDFLLGPKDEVAKPPPTVFVMLGLRFWRARLKKAPIKEKVFDFLMVPQRCTVDFEFKVIEHGDIHTLNEGIRGGLSLVQSTVGNIATLLAQF
jgi:hypothetical protein